MKAPIERRKPRIEHVSVGMFAPILAALVLAAGCGGDDETTTTTQGPTGAGSEVDVTVAEFIAELQPQKQEILEGFVGDSEACSGVKVDSGFVLLVTAQAIDADQEEPLADLVEKQC